MQVSLEFEILFWYDVILNQSEKAFSKRKKGVRLSIMFQYSKINVHKAHQLVLQLLKWFNKWFEARLNFNHSRTTVDHRRDNG